jgi:hypothetical protein
VAISPDIPEKVRTDEYVPELDLSGLKPDDTRKVTLEGHIYLSAR